jgi:hypothetical protein
MRKALCVVLLQLATAIAAIADDSPFLALHSENPHYFAWRGKPTVLITSGEHYGAVLNREFDYVAYLDELRAHGLNNTRTFSGVYREVPSSFGITDNPLAPRPGQFICPWARSDQPGESDGGNKFDLTRWDQAYFARLKEFLRAADQRGVVVELDLFCPMYRDDMWLACPMNARNNVNGIGQCGRNEVYTLQHDDLTQVQLAVTRKIVQELRDFGNLYYEVCNEPYAGKIPMEWQHRIIDTIVEAEKDFPRKHLISLNIANGRQKVENPHPAVSIFNFHYCHPPDVVALNYGLNKPIGDNETGFRGKDDILYRTEGWDFILAGGALYNNLDYSFTPPHPAGTFRDYRSPGGGSIELRRQLAILKGFIESFDFVKMKPDLSVVKQRPAGLDIHVLSEPGQGYAVYLHVPLPGRPKNIAEHLKSGMQAELVLALPEGKYTATWIDTKTGAATETAVPWSTEGVTLASPPFDNDIALGIRRAARR